MKSLATIQTLAKIGRILSKVIFAICLVGMILCAVGIVCLAVMGEKTLQIGGLSIRGLVEVKGELPLSTVYAAMAVGAVFCAVEVVLCKLADRYFTRELADGTPFTERGASELMRLGILTIVLPLVAGIVCAIALAICAHYFPGVKNYELEASGSVGLGIMMIVLSVFCRYGASLETKKNRAE